MSIIQGTSKSSAAGYTIDQSIRFNDDDSPGLTRTVGTATSRQTMTFSFWMKRSKIELSAAQKLIVANGSSDDQMEIYHTGALAYKIRFYLAGTLGGVVTSNALLRDPSAWYHIVVAIDTTQATASDRVKIYYNGELQTDLYESTYPSLNYQTLGYNNSGAALGIGFRSWSTPANFFDGYFAEINFIDGQALDPTSFGETNADTGQWVPIKYTGTYGNEGYYLKGEDSSNLGNDSSGNGNNFTSSGLTAADQRLDSPTLNKATLNGVNLYTTGSVLSDGNLTVTNSGTSGFWRRAYATQSLSYKTYWEVHADNLGSLNMGVSSLNNPNGGINNPAGNNGAGIQTNEAFVTGSYANESGGSRTFPISTGNYVMLAFDPDRGALWAGTEGTWKDGTASSASSATILAEIEGTGTSYALFTGIDADDAIPHIAQYSTSVATARFSSEDWEGTAPTGYEQLAPSSLPDPTIALPEKYFNTVLYEGNGGGQRVGGFQPITETYTVPNSVIFNFSDAAHLLRTPSTASNRRTWTWSLWVKRSGLGNPGGPNQVHQLFGVGAGSCLRFTSTDALRLESPAGNHTFVTSQVFKDTSSWYHIVLAFDSTQATDTDRRKLYVNGSQVTDFSSTTFTGLAQNAEWDINSTSQHQIAKSNLADYFGGYLAELNFIDGQALGPDSFGQLDASTNRWIPKDASGLTFGTNGFYLDMETAPGTGSGAGTDSSGNGNNWSESGLTASDQVTDSPTENFCVLNQNDKATQVTLANGNLQYGLSSNSYTAVRGTFGVSSGKWYWEMNAVSGMGVNTAYMGIATNASNLQTSSAPTDGTAYTYISYTGNKAYTSNTSYGDTWNTNGRVIGVALDLDAGKIWWSRDGVWQDSGDPAAGTNEAFSGITGTWYPYIVFNDSSPNFLFDFGQSGFTYTPPTGFAELNNDNLPLSNGDLSAFVWIKNRDAADNHMLFDAVRGVTKDLHSNSTAAEVTNANTLTRFLKNGFEVSNDAEVNTSGESYVAWQWLNDSLSTSANTDGSTSSTVLANTTSGFSIATYTGTGSAATIGHGLGVAPSMVIVKKRDSGTDDAWIIWHQDLAGPNYYLNFDTGAPDTSVNYWNNTLPTSSVFSVGASNGTNQSSKTFVSYCFAEVDGFSKFGSYTGNGSTDGAFVYTGFKPAFVLWKQYTNLGTNSWGIRDSARDPFNVVESVLRPDTTGTETTASTAYADFLSNGFKLRATDGFVNKASSNYLYMAFAESPFKTANAR